MTPSRKSLQLINSGAATGRCGSFRELSVASWHYNRGDQQRQECRPGTTHLRRCYSNHCSRRWPLQSNRSVNKLDRHHPGTLPSRHKFSGYKIQTTQQRYQSNTPTEHNDNKLRIAIVGGGAAGMTTALHLAPLVSAGLISGPIDVYEASVHKCQTTSPAKMGGRQTHPGSGSRGRDIGVGIWSTAWWPFLRSLEAGLNVLSDGSDDNPSSSMKEVLAKEKNRESYQTLLRDLEMCGSYVKEVGYRTPDGSWLVRSELNATPYGVQDVLAGEDGNAGKDKYDAPALLFVREKDLLSCLRNAVKIEKSLGTIALHSGVRVDGIENVSGYMGCLVCSDTTEDANSQQQPKLSKQYHLIIAADGLSSTLRSRYAGHHSVHATGIESSPSKSAQYSKWEHTKGQRLATLVEGRNYIVFRGNAPKLTEEDGSGSFQTWGEQRSMRFAAVPFRHACGDSDEDGDASTFHLGKSTWFEKKDEEEVWFATINDKKIFDTYRTLGSALTAEERKKLLLDAFGSWHKPVRELIESTPAEGIMYEMAVAHRFSASPVFDISSILEFERNRERKKEHEKYNDYNQTVNGPGPILLFIGDSMMTIDPVLAQGFTIAMESGASMARSLERVLTRQDNSSFRQHLLRKELKERHYRSEKRVLNLLRSTELVQRLAQPHGFISGFFATRIVRPVMKYCPEGLKKTVFDHVIRYSLGLTGRGNRGHRR